MEKVILRLPEDGAQVLEESLGDLLDVMLFTLVDQEEDRI
jgi:hypothetical protein